MNRVLAAALAAIATAGMLAGCTPTGPDQEATKAAAAYAEKLDAWAAELSDAAPGARTWTQAQIEKSRAKGAKELKDEVGMGEVLGQAPALEQFDTSVLERTPDYRRAAETAAEVDAVLTELRGLEPASARALRQAGVEMYYVGGDLYYDTLGGPATERVKARSKASDDHSVLSPEYRASVRESDTAFAEGRIELLDRAVAAVKDRRAESDEPTVPDIPLGKSVGAFIVAWYEEEQAFQQDSIEEIASWKSLAGQYDEFWGFEDLGPAFRAPLEHAATLRPLFAGTIEQLAEDLRAKRASAASAGDAYRKVLIDGYVRWDDPAASQSKVVERLWMLWRIREIEQTPDDAYRPARAALLEELSRKTEQGQSSDFRPGGTRVLVAMSAFVDGSRPDYEDAMDGFPIMFAGVDDSIAFAERLRGYPMMGEIAADFDAFIEQTRALREEMRAIADAEDPDSPENFAQYEKLLKLTDLREKAGDELTKTLTPSLSMLDDDEKFSTRLAQLIERTKPGAPPVRDEAAG